MIELCPYSLKFSLLNPANTKKNFDIVNKYISAGPIDIWRKQDCEFFILLVCYKH